jgi:hypothetical protein
VTPSAVLRDSHLLKVLPVLILAGVSICQNEPYGIRNKIPVISDFNIAIISSHVAVSEIFEIQVKKYFKLAWKLRFLGVRLINLKNSHGEKH